MCSNHCMRIFKKQCNSQKFGKKTKQKKKPACLSKKKTKYRNRT